MRKFMAVMGFAVLSLCALNANDKLLGQEELYSATIKEVDLGGTTLNYQNIQGLDGYVNSIVDMIANLAAQNQSEDPMAKMQMEMVVKVLKDVIKYANLSEMQSYAVSNKTMAKDLYANKSFVYTGVNPKGLLYDIMGRQNAKFQYLNIVPEDALFAHVSHVDMAKIYAGVVEILKESPQNIQAIQIAELQLGMSLADLMSSMSGEYVTFATAGVAGEELSAQALIRVPDQSGKLTQLLKRLMGIQGDVFEFPVDKNLPSFLKPLIAFSDKSVIIASNSIALNESVAAVESKKNIANSEKFAKYTNGLTDSGISCTYFALNENHLSVINSLLISSGQNIGNDPICFYQLSTVIPSGYKCQANSSFSIDPMKSAIFTQAILAGMMLPALEQARSKAKDISCVSQEKQLVVGLMMYSMDNKDKYPVENGEAGLKKLVDIKYCDAQLLLCPTANSGDSCDYIYIGNIDVNNVKNPSNMPVLFDKVGNHPAGKVNIAFADGHVAQFNLGTYDNEIQVIDYLNSINNYDEATLKFLKDSVNSQVIK